tara:strand:+ start:312 stop:806 length:495 start_codon:yes stop_codon:yes gene_type:complete
MLSSSKYWKGDKITELGDDEIFVFGSNPEGRHGMGAAMAALKFGATYGKGRGRQGNTYALVTKNLRKGYIEILESGDTIKYRRAGFRSVSYQQVKSNIKELYEYAVQNKHLTFKIAYILDDSNFLNGYEAVHIYKLFTHELEVPANIQFHTSWKDYSTTGEDNE